MQHWSPEQQKRSSPIDDDTNLELQALYAVQALFVQLEHQVYKRCLPIYSSSNFRATES